MQEAREAAQTTLAGDHSMVQKILRAAILTAVTLTFSAEARVVRFIVEQTRTFADGTSFGSVGQYQRLDGTAYMEVDPFDPLNSHIVNISKAPRNVRGMVEFNA